MERLELECVEDLYGVVGPAQARVLERLVRWSGTFVTGDGLGISSAAYAERCRVLAKRVETTTGLLAIERESGRARLFVRGPALHLAGVTVWLGVGSDAGVPVAAPMPRLMGAAALAQLRGWLRPRLTGRRVAIVGSPTTTTWLARVSRSSRRGPVLTVVGRDADLEEECDVAVANLADLSPAQVADRVSRLRLHLDPRGALVAAVPDGTATDTLRPCRQVASAPGVWVVVISRLLDLPGASGCARSCRSPGAWS